MSALATVYLLRDAEGDVLYVGVSGATIRRLGQHRGTRAWWASVASATFEHFDSRLAAIVREAELIRELRPPYNMFEPQAMERGDLPAPCAALASLMAEEQMTQQQMAVHAGVAVKSMYRWLNGEVPSRRMILRLASAFDRHPDFFFDAEPHDEPKAA